MLSKQLLNPTAQFEMTFENPNYLDVTVDIENDEAEVTLEEIIVSEKKREASGNKSELYYTVDADETLFSDINITLENSITEALKKGKANKEVMKNVMGIDLDTKEEKSTLEDVTIFEDALTSIEYSENINTDPSKEIKESLVRLANHVNVINCRKEDKETYIKGSLQAAEEEIELQLIFNRDSEEPVSCLLFGMPGCGKSHLIKKIAKKHNFNWKVVSTTEILDKYVGESEKKLKQIMEEASKEGPTLLLMDEIDGLMSMRSDKSGDAEEARKGVKNMMLNIMSGSEVLPNLFLYFTTNFPWTLDRAFIDRLTDSAKVDLPNTREKYKFFMEKAKKQEYQCSMSLEQFSSLDTTNFSFRQMDKLLKKASRNLQRRTAKAPHLTKLCSKPLKVTGCYCSGTCDLYNVPIMEIPSENLRCGTITFEDVSEGQRIFRIRGNMDQEENRKMEHFEEFGTVPKEDERKSHYNNEKETPMTWACQSHGHYETIGFLIFAFFAILFIYLVVNYIL